MAIRPYMGRMAIRSCVGYEIAMRSKFKKYHRRSIRLKNYDYSNDGAYFVTICAHQRRCLFGEMVKDNIKLNAYGRLVESEWRKTAELRDSVVLDKFVIMPNHVHGIIFIRSRGVWQYAPTKPRFRSPSQTLGAIIRGFKSGVTKRINEIRHLTGAPVWQRNYYEHIIRNENELNQIREYINNNPLQWELDEENPQNWRTVGAYGNTPVQSKGLGV